MDLNRNQSARTIDSTYGEDERSPLLINSNYTRPSLKNLASGGSDNDSLADDSLLPPPDHTLRHGYLYKISMMAILVCSGAAMTLCMKNQDETCLSHCPVANTTLPANETDINSRLVYGFLYPGNAGTNSDDSEAHYFHQPFIQLFHLGFGQLISGAFTPFFNSEEPNLKPISFRQFFPQAALASLFDVCAEILIILGLSFTLASVTEMLKTTMVVFVGLLSLYFFPGFHINWKQWVASGFMLCGSLIVILQNYLTGEVDSDTLSEIGGAFLVVGAQIFYGMEFVVEEKLIDHSKLKGLHVNKAQLVFALGILSMTGAIVLQIPWTLITSDFSTFYDELKIYFTTLSLILSGFGISLGVMGFDLAGLAISEVMGSDRRAISVAAFQVAIVWTISILVGWESFSFLSLGGFLLILASGAVYVLTSKEKSEPHQERRKKTLEKA